MKNTIAFAFACLLGLASKAQITLDESDFGSIGDVLYYATDTTLPTNFSVGASGANVTWNFATVGSNYSDSAVFVQPSEIVGAPEEANLAVVQDNFPEFYYIDSNGISTLQPTDGFIDGPPVSLSLMRFPFGYGDTERDSTELKVLTTPAEFGLDLPFDSLRITVNVTSVSVADGWGTLTTPTNSYSTLRVKNTSDAEITVEGKAPFIGTWAPIPFDFGSQRTVQYRWFGNGAKYHLASAELNDSGRVVSFSYQTNGILASIPTVQNKVNVKASPNPSNSFTTLSQLTDFGKQAMVAVFDMAGRQYQVNYTIQQNKLVLETSTLANGLYQVYVLDGNTQGVTKLMVQH